jgi:signal transduction histidine kinase
VALAFALALACMAMASAAPASDAAPGIQTVIDAEFCSSQSDAIPGPDCGWKAVRLANLWTARDRAAAVENAWYRLHFHLDAVPSSGVALYMVALNRSARFHVNGRWLAQRGGFDPPLPLNWNRAEYVVVPPALLQPGDNVLHVQERIYTWEHGWLSPVAVGPEAVLLPQYERRRFWQNDLVRMLGATTLVLSVFVLGVWAGRRDQTMYFWFGCATLTWSAISLDYFALTSPLPGLAWEGFIEIAQVLRSVLIYVFVLRYCGRRAPVLERAMWAWWVVGAVCVATGALPVRWVEQWYLGTLLASLWFFALLVREAMRRRRSEAVMLAGAAIVTIALSAYDLWLFSRHSWTDRFYLAHFGAPLFLFVLGWVLMRRFVESLNAHEKLAQVLEQRVEEKARELGRNVEQLIEARRSEALAVERTRIMSEMHDGIGSQLTMALSLVREAQGEDGRVAVVLRESIEDLQLIIDSLEPVDNDLLTVLGTLRYRLQDRLSRSGISLHWNVVDLPPLPMLTPHGVLAILRILQEAFANCLKHSGARTITVTTGLAGTPGVDEVAHIRIRDDGHGFDAPPPAADEPPAPAPPSVAAAVARRGRGVDNMRRRARAIGARLEITSSPGRTEVMLAIPTLRPA